MQSLKRSLFRLYSWFCPRYAVSTAISNIQDEFFWSSLQETQQLFADPNFEQLKYYYFYSVYLVFLLRKKYARISMTTSISSYQSGLDTSHANDSARFLGNFINSCLSVHFSFGKQRIFLNLEVFRWIVRNDEAIEINICRKYHAIELMECMLFRYRPLSDVMVW